MALRDQPYIPLYIQDFLTDEKLIECSATATGVYVRIMCIMHKSDEYGKILLRQKDKQNSSKIQDFAIKIAKHMPYTIDVIFASLTELISENVLSIDGDALCQKRMVRDNEISLSRSKSGRLGGIRSSKINNHEKDFAVAKVSANTEDENEIECTNSIKEKKEAIIIPIEEIGSEKVSIAANLVWKDGKWKENFCMGNNVTMEELPLWMAKFNASVCNDKIPDFGPSKYKKMLQGWVVAQKAKGTKVEAGSTIKKSDAAPLTYLQ